MANEFDFAPEMMCEVVELMKTYIKEKNIRENIYDQLIDIFISYGANEEGLREAYGIDKAYDTTFSDLFDSEDEDEDEWEDE